MGLIVTECPSFSPADARALESRISGELARRSDEETATKVSIRLHVHPDRARPRCTAAARSGHVPGARFAHGHPTIDHAIKRALDIIGSLTLLILLSPLFLADCGAGEAEVSGPGLLRPSARWTDDEAVHDAQVSNDACERRPQAPSGLHGAVSSSGCESGEPDHFFKIKNDPRVTPVGRFLRKTSLDELPQLWNVLRGDMSLVGPRPPIAYELQQYKPWHYRRVLEAKPGITGLWQVTGRSRQRLIRWSASISGTREPARWWTDIKISWRRRGGDFRKRCVLIGAFVEIQKNARDVKLGIFWMSINCDPVVAIANNVSVLDGGLRRRRQTGLSYGAFDQGGDWFESAVIGFGYWGPDIVRNLHSLARL